MESDGRYRLNNFLAVFASPQTHQQSAYGSSSTCPNVETPQNAGGRGGGPTTCVRLAAVLRLQGQRAAHITRGHICDSVYSLRLYTVWAAVYRQQLCCAVP